MSFRSGDDGATYVMEGMDHGMDDGMDGMPEGGSMGESVIGAIGSRKMKL